MTGKEIHEVLSEHYQKEQFVNVMPYMDDTYLFEGGFDITACNRTIELKFLYSETIRTMRRLS